MRERLSLDRPWRFALGHAADESRDFQFRHSRCLVKAGEGRGAADPKFDDSAWREVQVPHDWAIELPLDPAGDKELAEHGFRAIGPDHPEHSVGWYRRAFEVPESDLGRRITIEFDGVFRDCVVWVNGHRVARHQSGYTSFRIDVTDLLQYGGRNVVTVRVEASSWEGWWYEGAGIYRHVWLTKTSPLHVAHWGTFVTSDVAADHRSAVVTVRTTVRNDGDEPRSFHLDTQLRDSSGRLVATDASDVLAIEPWACVEIVQTIPLASVRLWSCDDPHLYTATTHVRPAAGEPTDRVETTFGIRSLRWDPDRGFFLNGQPLKIKGTCNHQQHAGVGVAMPDALQEFRVRKLKEMGSNAYRCSHYAATPELLDACDRLGLLVMAENRLAGSSDKVLGQFESMIRRDRNHPSIILWSLANEEHTVQWSVVGERIGRSMVRLAHRLDPTRAVTSAMHDRGFNEGFMHVVDVHGWNYIHVGDIQRFRDRNPHRPIVGSEEASTVTTRGIYADDPARGYVRAYDERTPKWGATAETWWTFFAERNWLAGGFVWTGFDYFGEPIPYKWPCTASHFGLMDVCGFPKDQYWYYRAWWTSERVLHLFPHWNWAGREGEVIDVRCYTNAASVELLLNGRSVGTREVERNSHAAWQVPYEAGGLEATATWADGVTKTVRVETTGEPVGLVLSADRVEIRGDGADVAVITVAACDDQGRAVPTAMNAIRFRVVGGTNVGVGNGDPSSHEPDKGDQRSLFNGLAMLLVQAPDQPGPIVVEATADGLAAGRLELRAT